jgi:raffinose/stachyose/melibiose transport system permease protein
VAVTTTAVTSHAQRRLTTAVLWGLTALTLFPLALILAAALTPQDQLVGGFSLPRSVTGANFSRAWTQGDFAHHLLVSAGVTSAIVLLAGTASVLGGYALGALRTPGERLLAPVFILGIVVPYEALVIPIYYHLRSAGLTDTYWALVLPQSALSMAFGIYWMRAFFRAVPRSLAEAAKMDGASSFTILRYVMVPIGAPAIATMVVLMFMWNWNEFLLPVVMISSVERAPAPVALATFQGRFGSDTAALAAGALIVAAPIVALYTVLFRRFMAAVLDGGIKG